MNEIAEYPFAKPALLDRDEAAKRKAAELREKGCVTGVTCCLSCFLLSNFFFDESEANAGPKDWANILCPWCSKYGSIFLHDAESLEVSKPLTES